MTKINSIIIIAVAAILVVSAPWTYRHIRYPDYCKYSRQLHLTRTEARKALGKPSETAEWNASLYNSAYEGDWQHILKLTQKDRTSEIGSYYRNLAKAMTGSLPDGLMDYYQPFERGLFLPVNSSVSPFQIGCSAEVWYRLGALTMAEHSYMLSLIFSPHHYSTCALKRLAEISLIRGDDQAAAKYLRMLMKERGCRRWASDRLPGRQTEEVAEWLEQRREQLPETDIVHTASGTRAVLRNLLESHPESTLVMEYLLCFDILVKDLDSFIVDYQAGPGPVDSRLYQEAVLIFLAANDQLNEAAFKYFAIPSDVVKDFAGFSQMYASSGGDLKKMQAEWGDTYWFYYRYARRNEK